MTDTYNMDKFKLNDTIEEAYKVLRANIQFSQLKKKIKTITITSCNPNEGKSTTSINLSISMAKTGMNVLYVDADIRKPLPFKILTGRNFKGLSNYLKGHSTLSEIINKTTIDGFSFITCGIKTNNPGELIASEKFNLFLEEIEKFYDLIIIDTPPLSSVIDAAIIAKQTDGTIIVMESNKVREKNALKIKNQLQKANANIIGVVLNKIKPSEYKYYYGNYNYYGLHKKTINRWLRQLTKKRSEND